MNRKSRGLVCVLLLAVAAGSVLFGESVWSGSAAVGQNGEFPDGGSYASSNSFPKNTLIELTNLENGKNTTVAIITRLDNPALFLLISKDAADKLGIQPGDIAQVRATHAQADTLVRSATEDRAYSRDPDINPAAVVTNETEKSIDTIILSPEPALFFDEPLVDESEKNPTEDPVTEPEAEVAIEEDSIEAAVALEEPEVIIEEDPVDAVAVLEEPEPESEPEPEPEPDPDEAVAESAEEPIEVAAAEAPKEPEAETQEPEDVIVDNTPRVATMAATDPPPNGEVPILAFDEPKVPFEETATVTVTELRDLREKTELMPESLPRVAEPVVEPISHIRVSGLLPEPQLDETERFVLLSAADEPEVVVIDIAAEPTGPEIVTLNQPASAPDDTLRVMAPPEPVFIERFVDEDPTPEEIFVVTALETPARSSDDTIEITSIPDEPEVERAHVNELIAESSSDEPIAVARISDEPTVERAYFDNLLADAISDTAPEPSLPIGIVLAEPEPPAATEEGTAEEAPNRPIALFLADASGVDPVLENNLQPSEPVYVVLETEEAPERAYRIDDILAFVADDDSTYFVPTSPLHEPLAEGPIRIAGGREISEPTDPVADTTPTEFDIPEEPSSEDMLLARSRPELDAGILTAAPILREAELVLVRAEPRPPVPSIESPELATDAPVEAEGPVLIAENEPAVIQKGETDVIPDAAVVEIVTIDKPRSTETEAARPAVDALSPELSLSEPTVEEPVFDDPYSADPPIWDVAIYNENPVEPTVEEPSREMAEVETIPEIVVVVTPEKDPQTEQPVFEGPMIDELGSLDSPVIELAMLDPTGDEPSIEEPVVSTAGTARPSVFETAIARRTKEEPVVEQPVIETTEQAEPPITEVAVVEKASEEPEAREPYSESVAGVATTRPVATVTAAETRPPADIAAPTKIVPIRATSAVLLDFPKEIEETSTLTNERYYLQLAVFADEKNARKLSAELFAKHYPTTVFRPDDPESRLFKVLVGPLTEDESGALLFSFRARGYNDAFVRRGP